MGKDPADDTLESDEVDSVFALSEPPDDPDLEATSLEDELLDSAADAPLVEPLPIPRPPRAPTPGPTKALVFFGVVVTLLLAAQTVRSFLPQSPPTQIVTLPPPVAPVKPAVEPAPLPSPEDAAARAAQTQKMLQQMRDALSRGLYEDVVRLLEPIASDPARLDRDQRWQADLLLAKAYRALDNVEKAQEYTLRATDQMIERRAPAQTLEYASELARSGRHAEARTELMKLLARRDGFTRKEEPTLSMAEARVADAWYAQARQSGHLAPLPGARDLPPSPPAAKGKSGAASKAAGGHK